MQGEEGAFKAHHEPGALLQLPLDIDEVRDMLVKAGRVGKIGNVPIVTDFLDEEQRLIQAPVRITFFFYNIFLIL